MDWSQNQRAALLRLELSRRHSGAVDLLTWTALVRYELIPGRPFDLRRHPFLVDIYKCIAREQAYMKAGQVGMSELLISYALHAADQRQATALYVFPTDTHVSDFSRARLGPALEASPYLDGIVVGGSPPADSPLAGGKAKRRRGADRVTLKRVRDRFVYLRGGQVSPDGQAAQLKSIDADVLILDEIDEMDARAPSIAEKRLGHSQIGEIRWCSTPSSAGVGIHAIWGDSDRRQWMVRCHHCGGWQTLTIQDVVVEWDDLERPTRWYGQGENRAWAACRKCGGEIDRLGRGCWVAERPGAQLVGWHLTKLFSPWADLLSIVRTLQSTDETKRKECFNQDLGLPYTPRGGRLTGEELDDCRRDYAHRPVGGESTVMGVDVGKLLYGVIRGPKNEGGRAQRWAGAVGSFEEIDLLMRRYQVGRLVIDGLPETRKARELQERWPRGRVWLAYYPNQAIGSKRSEAAQWDHREGVVNIDRTRAMDATLARFYDRENTLPAHARDVADYYAHLCAPVRVEVKGPGGAPVARYEQVGADHLAHAEVYCAVASLGQISLGSEDVEEFGGYGG